MGLADEEFSMCAKNLLVERRASPPGHRNAGPFDFAQGRLARRQSLHFFSGLLISSPAFLAAPHIPDAVFPSAIYRTIPRYCRAAQSDAMAHLSATSHASRAEKRPWRSGASETRARGTVALHPSPAEYG